MGNDLALYVGVFMCCTIVLIIPGAIFLLYWAVTRNDGEDKTQYIEHHHHYDMRENKTINIDFDSGGKHTNKHENFQGYLELK